MNISKCFEPYDGYIKGFHTEDCWFCRYTKWWAKTKEDKNPICLKKGRRFK